MILAEEMSYNGETQIADDSNMSAHVESDGECQSDHKNAQYLLVDYGDKLIAEMEMSKLELHKQTMSLMEKTDLLWDVVRTFITLILPVVTGLGLTILSRMCLPNYLSPWFFTIFIGITVGFIFINLPPLAESVGNYLSFQVYTPQFDNCKCSSCMANREVPKATDTVEAARDVAEDIGTTAETVQGTPATMPDLNELD